MDKIKLTKREYLGLRWMNVWQDQTTQDIRFEESTEDVYQAIATGNNKEIIPPDTDLEKRIFSYTLETAVDTLDRNLGVNEYTILPDGRYMVRMLNETGRFPHDTYYSEEEFNSLWL